MRLKTKQPFIAPDGRSYKVEWNTTSEKYDIISIDGVKVEKVLPAKTISKKKGVI